jgi:hypothetical protein
MVVVVAFAMGMLLTAYNYEASGQVNGTSSKNYFDDKNNFKST